VLAAGDHAINPIDLATGLPEPAIAVGWWPEEIAISPDGSFAYVSDTFDDTLTRIDLGTDSVVATIPMSSPGDIEFAPDGATAYVNLMDDLVQPVRTSDDALLEPVAVHNLVSQIAITPDGSMAYVSSYADASITPIDLASHAVGAPVPMAAGAQGLAIAATPAPIPTDPPTAPDDPATPPTPAPPGVGDGSAADPQAVPVDSLPYTGAGVAMSAAIGAALLAAGLAARAAAERRRRELSSPEA
jgi:YVTN family beta-propeller protein